MLDLTNIDLLLEDWKNIRTLHSSRAMHDVISREYKKDKVDILSQKVREARLTNSINEEEIICEFVEAYYEYSREFMIEVLSNNS